MQHGSESEAVGDGIEVDGVEGAWGMEGGVGDEDELLADDVAESKCLAVEVRKEEDLAKNRDWHEGEEVEGGYTGVGMEDRQDGGVFVHGKAGEEEGARRDMTSVVAVAVDTGQTGEDMASQGDVVMTPSVFLVVWGAELAKTEEKVDFRGTEDASMAAGRPAKACRES